MALRNEDGRSERAAQWLTAWNGQEQAFRRATGEAAQDQVRLDATEAAGAPAQAPEPRTLALTFLAVGCAMAAMLVSGWTPQTRSASASALDAGDIAGAWTGACRSGETRQAIPLAIHTDAEGRRLVWSRYTYPLAPSPDGSWAALRNGAPIGSVHLDDDGLHVRMRNFRCGWIVAQRA